MKTARNKQIQAILEKAASACTALMYEDGHKCWAPGCNGDCHGCITTESLHEIGFCPTARIRQMRKDGWIIDCIRTPSDNNIFHIVRKVDVQADLPIGESLQFVGLLPGEWEMLEVCR